MKRFCIKTFIFLCWLASVFPSFSQDLPAVGSVKIIGQPQINEKKVILDRKRFYLMRGGLKENENLIKRLKSTEIISRDCFYANLKASPEFMCWLKKYNCESPYCREITMEDVNEVPEFLSAYRKSLRQYAGQSEIARLWLTTNLPFDLREGFYRQQKSMINSLVLDARPVQTIMTDGVLGLAYFIDVPLNLENAGGAKKKTETFLISNLLPVEIGETSYVWACEVEIGDQKQATLNLKDARRCVIVSRDLPVCKTQSCT
jgi:hypothetical protein